MDMGPLVVTPEVLDRVAFERSFKIALSGMSKGFKKVFNRIIKLDADSQDLWFSQEKIADKLGLCRSTVRRALAYFKKHGLIQWSFRGVKKTCVYKLNVHLGSKVVRDKFVSQVSNFKLISMSVLMERNAVLFEGATPAISTEIKVENEPQCPSERILISLSLSLSELSKKRSEKREIERLTESLTVRVREGHGLASLFLSKNQENVMSQVYSQSLSIAAAANVSSFKLTSYGKHIVASYHHEAIAFADAEMKKKKGKIQKPMGLFCSLAKQYSDKNGLKGNFSRLQEFRNDNPGWESIPEFEPALAPAPSESNPIKKTGANAPYQVTEAWRLELDPHKEVADAIRILQERGEPVNKYLLLVKEGHDRVAAGEPGVNLADYYPSFMKPLVRDPNTPRMSEPTPVAQVMNSHKPLKDGQRSMLEKLIEHRDVLGEGDNVELIVTQMRELLVQGMSHPMAKNIEFWDGVQWMVDLINLQPSLMPIEPEYGIDSQLSLG